MRRVVSILFAFLILLSPAVALDLNDRVTLKPTNAQGVPLHSRAESSMFGRGAEGVLGRVVEFAHEGRWARVALDDGRIAWIVEKYLEVAGAGSPTAPTPTADVPTTTAGTAGDGVPDGYYASATGKSGQDLEEALRLIIRGHKAFTYGQVWEQLGYTDADPQDPSRVILLYTGRSEPFSNRDQGQNDPDSWNREHVWAKSHGFPERSMAAYTDIHHLRPADRSTNTDRSDKDFDFSAQPHDEAPGARFDSDSFEPPDQVKGDVARMLFYMDVRYNGSDGENGDLELVDDDSDRGEPALGHLCVLIAWHGLDSVDAWEQRRNNRIFERQLNRNPFIDHPEYVTAIWGGVCD